MPQDPESRVDLSGLRALSEEPPPVKPERRSRDGALPRMIAFFLAALIFAAAPWYVFTRVLRNDKGEKPKPAATAPTTMASVSPTPTPVGTPGTYLVVTEAKCLNMRAGPGTDQAKLTCLGKGLKVTSDGKVKTSGGMEWMHITYKNFDGWAASQYLEKVG